MCRLVLTPGGVLKGVRHVEVLRTLIDVEFVQFDVDGRHPPVEENVRTILNK